MIGVERLNQQLQRAAASEAAAEDDVDVARAVVRYDARLERDEPLAHPLGEIALDAAAAHEAAGDAALVDDGARTGTPIR